MRGGVIYINYGSKDDHDQLEKMGVNVKGMIGIARYGKIFRGTIAMIAQQRGMIAVLIYNDPADDGYAKGPVYPLVCFFIYLFIYFCFILIIYYYYYYLFTIFYYYFIIIFFFVFIMNKLKYKIKLKKQK